MGNGLTDDKELLVRIGDEQAGGVKGQLILEDLNVNFSRDNTRYSGIGNEGTTGTSHGNVQVSLSLTDHLNESGARMLDAALNSSTPVRGIVRSPNLEVAIGELDWNNIDLDAADEDTYQLSIDFDGQGYEVKQGTFNP
jgi:hypothetical protein